jgi:hypothetical protein
MGVSQDCTSEKQLLLVERDQILADLNVAVKVVEFWVREFTLNFPNDPYGLGGKELIY